MKYIARCVLNNKTCPNACSHAKEHDWNKTCPLDERIPNGSNCQCIPLDLEHYMRKTIKEREENEDKM
jgi:hypothetical protein